MVSVYLAIAVSIAGHCIGSKWPITVLSVVPMSEKQNRSAITVYSALLRDSQATSALSCTFHETMPGIAFEYFSTHDELCGSEMCVSVGCCLPTWKDGSSRTWIPFPAGITRLSKSSSNFLQTASHTICTL